MGGNAFPNVKRIDREHIQSTVRFVVDSLQLPNFTIEYVEQHLMGSTGKKETSGDIDIAVNTYQVQFFGEVERPVFDMQIFLNRVKQVLPKSQIDTHTFSMGNLITAWPIAGDPNLGLVQIDFIFGKAEWLLFTHYSPAPEESRFKGVYLSQGLAVLAKMLEDFVEVDPTRTEQDGISPLRVGRVGLHLSLELGLFRSWRAEIVKNQGPRRVDPGDFETKFPNAARYPRIGYISDPQAVLDIILAPGVTYDQVNSFEKLVRWVAKNKPEHFMAFKERFIDNFARHTKMGLERSVDEFRNDPVWSV